MQKLLVGTSPSTWNFGSKWPRWSEIADFRSVFVSSASAVYDLAKKVQLTLKGSKIRELWPDLGRAWGLSQPIASAATDPSTGCLFRRKLPARQPGMLCYVGIVFLLPAWTSVRLSACVSIIGAKMRKKLLIRNWCKLIGTGATVNPRSNQISVYSWPWPLTLKAKTDGIVQFFCSNNLYKIMHCICVGLSVCWAPIYCVIP